MDYVKLTGMTFRGEPDTKCPNVDTKCPTVDTKCPTVDVPAWVDKERERMGLPSIAEALKKVEDGVAAYEKAGLFNEPAPLSHWTKTIRDAEEGVRAILRYIGADPDAKEFADTPGRVIDALYEMVNHDGETAAELLGELFPVRPGIGEVTVKGIAFSALCPHHLMPYHGTAEVTYWPNVSKGVVGLSKIARLVAWASKTLQTQENLGNEIARELSLHTEASRVEVSLTATHTCMACRGALASGATTLTTAAYDTL